LDIGSRNIGAVDLDLVGNPCLIGTELYATCELVVGRENNLDLRMSTQRCRSLRGDGGCGIGVDRAPLRLFNDS